jgi:pimeloyl-ACP methyl ester carboxylesterase
MKHTITEEGEFKYLDTGGSGVVLMLLHGLFGHLSNFDEMIEYFGEKRRVVVPILPMYEMPLRKATVNGLVEHVTRFVKWRGYDKLDVMGNSLGGHIALLFALTNPEKTRSIVLTGSSGLFENALGSSFPKRSNREFVRQKTETVFYDPKDATEEMVDEVYDIVNDRNKALRLITLAKSAIRENLSHRLDDIKAPTLLVWGMQDTITPPFVAEQFGELINESRVVFIDKCGHAPMMEHPDQFNGVLEEFLKEVETEFTEEQVG